MADQSNASTLQTGSHHPTISQRSDRWGESTLALIAEDWFLTEPAFFALYCQQQLTENVRMECPVRCGQGRLEYNPLLLAHKNHDEVEQLLRIELIRLYLKHPYERQPEGCCHEAMSIGSNITIADGYCNLHNEKLPLHDPAFYHLPLGQYYEWYAKAIQQQNDDERRNKNGSGKQDPDSASSQNANSVAKPDSVKQETSTDANHSLPSDSGEGTGADDHAALWREDSLARQRINDLIERTTDWGTLPADLVERIKASTRARIDTRLIWQGFHSAMLSSQRHLTRMRPNRRTAFLQMGSTRQFDTHLLIAIDMSGSVTTDILADFFSSVNRLFRYGIAQIDLCQFDATLGPVEPMRRVHPEIAVVGRGGTSFQPIIDYITEHRHTYDGLIILTDGQAPPPHSADCALPPILWVCHNRSAYETHHEWMQKTGRCTYL